MKKSIVLCKVIFIIIGGVNVAFLAIFIFAFILTLGSGQPTDYTIYCISLSLKYPLLMLIWTLMGVYFLLNIDPLIKKLAAA